MDEGAKRKAVVSALDLLDRKWPGARRIYRREIMRGRLSALAALLVSVVARFFRRP